MVNWFELKRQSFHLLLGLTIAILFYFEIMSEFTLLFVLLAGIILSFISSKYPLPIIRTFLSAFERKDARFPGEGAIFFITGSLIALALFPKDIALASIMVLAFGDSMATVFGTHIGKRKIKNKSLEGSVAGLIFGFFGAWLFVDAHLAFFGCLAAMAFEAIEIRFMKQRLNDNLFIPIIAAIIMEGMRWL